MSELSYVTGLLPYMEDPFTATDVLLEYVGRSSPNATFVGAGMGEEKLARRDVEFSIPADAAQGLAEDLRSIGLDNIEIDGKPHVPHLEPNDKVGDAAHLATPVEFTRAGKPKAPRRKIVEVHHGSTTLECGHIGKKVSGLGARLPEEPRFVSCNSCLPMRDRRHLIAGFDDFRNSWIVSQTNYRLKHGA